MKNEQFIQKAKLIHGKKYDYSKVEYVHSKQKVCIICHEKDEFGNEHGEFWQTPRGHLSGNGCKKCQYEKVSQKRRLTNEDFINRCLKLYDNKYSYEKTVYIKSNEKVIITCPKHGDFLITPNDFLDGHGCKKCANELNSIRLKGNKEEFIKKAKKIHGDKYDYTKVEYITTEKKVCIICPEHGEFWQTPHGHLSGNGCKKCAIKNRVKQRSHSIKDFIEKAELIHENKYNYSLIKSYNNGKDKIPIICPKHGLFYQRAEDHLAGHGCKKCYKSKLEDEIINFLEENHINYEYRLKNKFECSELDFYLPEFNVCIECQGLQHFKPVDFGGKGIEYAKREFKKIIKNDKLKLNNTKKYNIKMLYFSNIKIDFPYKVFTNKEELLIEIKNGEK